MVYVHSLSLRDDLGKVVAHVDIDGVKNSGVVELDLQRGDINYDHVLDSADRDMLLNYVNYVRYQKDKGAFEYSTLQKDLMDINADGKITKRTSKHSIMTAGHLTESTSAMTALYGQAGTLSEEAITTLTKTATELQTVLSETKTKMKHCM